MRTLVTAGIPAEEVQDDEAVRFRPDLDPLVAECDAVHAEIARFRPEVIVASAEPPDGVVASWSETVDAPVLLWVQIGAADHPARQCPSATASRVEHHVLRGDGDGDGGEPPAVAALGLAERRRSIAGGGVHAVESVWRRLDAASPYRGPGRCRPGGPVPRPSVLLVGAGVVNLVSASLLARHGFAVTVLDRAPDPRRDAHWSEYGCSRGGADARMFTLTEADDYHDLVSEHRSDVFDRPPSECGWDVRAGGRTPTEWVREFRATPEWMATTYRQDTAALNARSGRLWEDWTATAPHLFADVGLRHGVLRLYQDPGHLASAVRRQRRAAALLDTLSPDGVRDRYPALGDARDEAFAGGLLVRGFTLGVHGFIDRLLSDLTARGADLVFGTEVDRAVLDGQNRVHGVRTVTGEVRRADHYVVSTGAHGSAPVQGTETAGRIHGVLGCWLSVPNPEPRLETSLKVARRGHVTEDANVTVARDGHGRPALIVGSGYGYTGAEPGDVDADELDAMRRGIADTVEQLFPAAYEAAGGVRLMDSEPQYCTRPWTASNLGVFESRPAVSGSFVITGGNNTGGFAQAPVIAEAVLDELTGRRHPMHTLYHPSRMDRSLGVPAGAR